VSITETLAAGVEDTLLIKASGEHSTWQDLVQACGRPRRLKYLFAAVAEYGRADWHNAQDYADALREGRAWDDQLLTSTQIIDGEIHNAPLDADFAASRVSTRIHECNHRRALGQDWWNYWQSQGFSVRDVDLIKDDEARKVVRETAKTERAKAKEADAVALAEADNDGMTAEDAQAILDRDSTPEERLAAHKTLLEEFLGKAITVELAKWDDRGRGRAQVRALADLRLAATGQMDKLALLSAPEAGKTAKKRHPAMAAKLSWMILEAFGVRAGHLDGTDLDPTLDPAELLKLHDWLAMPKTRRACKLALGCDPKGFLAGGQGRRRRGESGGVLNDQIQTPDPVDQADLDQDDLSGLDPSGPGGPGGVLNIEITPPGPVDLDQVVDDFDPDSLDPTRVIDPDARIHGHQLWAFAAQILRRVGLRFNSVRAPRSPGAKVRPWVRSMDLDQVAVMTDYAAAEWARRQDAVVTPGSITMTPEGVVHRLPVVRQTRPGLATSVAKGWTEEAEIQAVIDAWASGEGEVLSA
jgi:hypothetical protein